MKIIIISLKDALTAQQRYHCIHTLKAETNTLTSHLKLVMTTLIVHLLFHKNQIRRLRDESPYELEVLRASCTGQTREMVNLFCVPMKNVSTSARIEKVLNRLRQQWLNIRTKKELQYVTTRKF